MVRWVDVLATRGKKILFPNGKPITKRVKRADFNPKTVSQKASRGCTFYRLAKRRLKS